MSFTNAIIVPLDVLRRYKAQSTALLSTGHANGLCLLEIQTSN